MSAIRKRLYYYWKKLSEKESRKKFECDNNKQDIARFNASTNRKPKAQIKREMQALQRYWDCFPYQYYRYDFYKNDCTVSLEEMKTYVPHFFVMSLFFPHSYKAYGVICEDKLLTYATLKSYNVAQPRLLFCYDNTGFSNSVNNPISCACFNNLLQTCTASKLFLKPRFGLGGRGILVFNKTPGKGFINEAGQKLDAALLRQKLGTAFYIAQEGLEQHESMNVLYPHSVNTFRIFTEYCNGEVRVLFALVRMGSGGQQIDNASAGGLYLKIDAETGMLRDSAFAFDRLLFYKHPDTGFLFKDHTIETWTEAKAFTITVARKFRDIKYMGWDVAVTVNGPVIIEMNNAPGVGIIQDCYGGIRDVLNINPKDWWYQSNYTIKNL